MWAHAIILLAHGSRDPLWRQPMEAVAKRMRELEPGVAVQCAYLELAQPDLAHCAHALISGGATHIRVVPLFLGLGKHAREDLPRLAQQLRLQHPHVVFELQAAVGENPLLVDLLAQIALHR
jgi:sirohydrochlorin cobaltochelatase